MKGKNWIEHHWKHLIIAGGFTAIVTVILRCMNDRCGVAAQSALQQTTEQTVSYLHLANAPLSGREHAYPYKEIKSRRKVSTPFDVRKHLRNLPAGCHASVEKIETASENGFALNDRQTWVTGFKKGSAA